jgi:hypothetical protein
MKRHRVLSILAIFVLVATLISLPELFPNSVIGSPSQPATPVASPAVSCTVWSQEGVYGADRPEQCTLSLPWWNAWQNCDITPVHAELFEYPRPFDQHLKSIPWIVADSDDVTLIGHLFYGNRPLIAGGHYDLDGANAKLLWEFGERVELESITGVNLWNLSETMTMPFSVANSNDSVSTEFPTIMDFPAGGCWQTTLVGTTEAGVSFSATVIFIVIDK